MSCCRRPAMEPAKSRSASWPRPPGGGRLLPRLDRELPAQRTGRAAVASRLPVPRAVADPHRVRHRVGPSTFLCPAEATTASWWSQHAPAYHRRHRSVELVEPTSTPPGRTRPTTGTNSTMPETPATTRR